MKNYDADNLLYTLNGRQFNNPKHAIPPEQENLLIIQSRYKAIGAKASSNKHHTKAGQAHVSPTPPLPEAKPRTPHIHSVEKPATVRSAIKVPRQLYIVRPSRRGH